MTAIKERDYLMDELNPRKTGFTPRRIQSLTKSSLPTTMVNIECNHLLRTFREESTHGHSSVEYQLWLEAGKHDPPFPNVVDENYNANTWRNFRVNYGFNLSTKGRSTSESVACAYPLTIPKPSKIGDYTYTRFLKENSALISDRRVREVVLSRTSSDYNSMKLLKLRSDCRYPPIDLDGNIIPPEHYRHHKHYFQPIDDVQTTEYLVEQMRASLPTPYGYHDSPIKYKPRKSPAWRIFNLKSSNKNFEKLTDQLNKHQNLNNSVSRAHTHTPANSSHPSDMQE